MVLERRAGSPDKDGEREAGSRWRGEGLGVTLGLSVLSAAEGPDRPGQDTSGGPACCQRALVDAQPVSGPRHDTETKSKCTTVRYIHEESSAERRQTWGILSATTKWPLRPVRRMPCPGRRTTSQTCHRLLSACKRWLEMEQTFTRDHWRHALHTHTARGVCTQTGTRTDSCTRRLLVSYNGMLLQLHFLWYSLWNGQCDERENKPKDRDQNASRDPKTRLKSCRNRRNCTQTAGIFGIEQ